ncbi:hypothetical protein QQ045_004096 [Rhodiola kirilowii]
MSGSGGEIDSMSKFKKICVFCGSNSGNRDVFSDAALDLGNEMVCHVMFFCCPLLLCFYFYGCFHDFFFLLLSYVECFIVLQFFPAMRLDYLNWLLNIFDFL